MEALKTASLAVALLLAGAAARADDSDWDEIFAPYRQRIDTATTSSGNAQDVNAATQVITPWPPYVHNRRIPGDGARMVGAIERYHNPGGAIQQAKKPQAPTQETGNEPPNGSGNGAGGEAQSDKARQTAPSEQ